MVEVLIGDDMLVLVSKKAIDKKVAKALANKNFQKKFENRIKSWLADYGCQYDVHAGTLLFSRKLGEEDINPNGLEATIAKLQEDALRFEAFITSLMEEPDNEPGNQEESTEEGEDRVLLKITEYDDHLEVEGVMNPLEAISLLKTMVIQMVLEAHDNNEKENN